MEKMKNNGNKHSEISIMLLFPHPCYTYLFKVPVGSIKLVFKNYFRKTGLWLEKLLQFICQKLCILLAKTLPHSFKIFLVFSSLSIIFRYIMKFWADITPLSNKVSGRPIVSYVVFLCVQTSISISEKNRLEKKKQNISNLLQKMVDAEVDAEKDKWIRIKKTNLAHKALKYSLENNLSTHSWLP